MYRAGFETENWSNPELVRFGSFDPDTAADPEIFNASTLDPSHIIHLIRQLLPSETRASDFKPECGVVRAKVVEGVSSEAHCITQEVLGAVEDVEAHKNATMHAGNNVEREENAINSPSINPASQPASGNPSIVHSKHADGSVGDKIQNETDLLEVNGSYGEGSHAKEKVCCTSYMGQTDNHTDHIGKHVNNIRDPSRNRGTETAKVREEEGDTPDHSNKFWRRNSELSQNVLTSTSISRSEAQSESTILTARESKVTEKPPDNNDADQKVNVDEDAREDAGCVLWDLAASDFHAQFLVQHHILDVLLALLNSQISDRTREICLGVLGNLACHPGPVKAMAAMDGLVSTVVQQLFVENVPILTETCRLLSGGLHSEGTVIWAECIKPDHVLERIMWMAANTLNSQLLEKCTELILVMVDRRNDAAFWFLPSLLRLGLLELLTDLIDSEVTAIGEGISLHGDVVLDIVLQIAEVVSISDESAAQLAASDKVFSLSCEVIRLSASDEIGPSGITAIVLIANLLTEEAGFIQNVLHDAVVVGRLLALVPCAGDDPGARNALWSILGRICYCLIMKPDHPQYETSGTIAVLADGCSLLLDDLDVHQQEDVEEDDYQALAGQDAAASTSRGLKAKLATVGNMMGIMERWTSVHVGRTTQDTPLFRSVRNAGTLLEKHLKTMKD